MLSKADIKLINSLKHKKYRQMHNLFIAEGVRLVHDALKQNALLKQLFLTESFSNNPDNKAIIDLIAKRNITSEILTDKQFKSISETVTPAGLFAICEMPRAINFKPDSRKNYLYLDTIQEPGNLGTLLRSANWFGVNDIILSKNCIDVYNPKVVRSAMGAHFQLNTYNDIDLKVFSNHTKLGAFMQGDRINNIDGKTLVPWVLIIGNEAHGISDKNQNLIDKKLSIPKIGGGESLNAATAGSILLYQLTASLLSDQ